MNKQTEREISIRKILDTAMTLFANKGYESTTTEEIARKARVSKGLIYFYFSSKEEILTTLIESIFTEVSSEVPPQLAPMQVIEYMLAEFKRAMENPEWWKIATAVLFQTERKKAVRNILREKYLQYRTLLSEQFQKLGSPDPVDEARELLAILDGVALHSMFAEDLVKPERVFEFTLNRYKKKYKV